MPSNESSSDWQDAWNKSEDELTDSERRARNEYLQASVDRARLARRAESQPKPASSARPRSEERYPVPAPELKITRKELAARRRRRSFLSSLPLIPAGFMIAADWPNIKANAETVGTVPLWEMPWMPAALVLMLISIAGLSITAWLDSRGEAKIRAEEEPWS